MEPAIHSPPRRTAPTGDAGAVFVAFLLLGLTAFGGPIAHVGYFREAFVRRRGWLDEATFAQLLAVCQFLPGPASSQLGLAIGLLRAGWKGAVAAFAGFTLPSALLMFVLALLAPRLGAAGAVLVHGLKLVAVAVVASGTLGMARQLTPDAPRLAIATLAAALVLWLPVPSMQLVVIGGSAVLGLVLCRRVPAPAAVAFPVRYGLRTGAVLFAACLLGLAAALLLPASSSASVGGLFAAFYRAGALVFGGGHVVLPLLQQATVDPGWIEPPVFLAGYGAAQAVPGPMFTLAAFLGAAALPDAPAAGAAAALAGIFLPGFALLLAVLPAWSRLVRGRHAGPAMAGVNAAVVGLLAAALYDPVWTTGVAGPVDAAIALAGFALLAFARLPPLAVVAGCLAATVLATWLA